MTGVVRRWRRLRARWFALRHRRVTIGRGCELRGRLVVGGRGRIEIGAGCRIKSATIFALHDDSLVTIGPGCYLNGPEIAAAVSVTIGAHCDVGSAIVFDTDFHPLQRVPRGPVAAAPIHIGDDVWLAARTAVLRGSVVGDRSVVGLGAVVTGVVLPDTLVRPGPVRTDPLTPPVTRSAVAGQAG